MSRTRVTLNLTFALATLFAFLSWESWHNTLHNKDKWKSGKVTLEKAVMGSAAFMISYRPLAGNRLDLSTWFSYQQIIYKKPFQTSRLSFELELKPGGELFLFLSEKEGLVRGLRFFKPEVDSPVTIAREFSLVQGQYSEKDREWSIEEEASVSKVSIGPDFVKQPKKSSIPWPSPIENLKFWGNSEPVLLDAIRFKDELSNTWIEENFNPAMTFWPWLVFGLLGLILLNFAAIRLKSFQKWAIRLGFLMCLLSVGWFFFFKRSMQYKYQPFWTLNFQDYENRIEGSGSVRKRVKAKYSGKQKKKNQKRILMIGSSQTWGAGASKEENTFVRLFEKQLNADQDSLEYVCINTGISAMTSDSLWLFYQEDWLDLEPDEVVINLGNNDQDSSLFRQSMRSILEINAQNEIPTLLILEPNDFLSDNLIINHGVSAKLAREYGFSLFDLQAHMDKSENPLMFWDYVHFTDYGHQWAAKGLFESYMQWGK